MPTEAVGTDNGFARRSVSRRGVVAAALALPAAKLGLADFSTGALADELGSGPSTRDFTASRFSARINIGDSAPASPYGSTITVEGLKGQVRDVNVILNGFDHDRPTDVGIMLSFRGRSTTLMRGASDGTPISFANILLDSDSGNPLPPSTGEGSGPLVGTQTYAPVDYTAGAAFGGSAGKPNDTESKYLDFFDGLSPNGEWTLWIRDDQGNQLAGFLEGWTLEIVTNDDGEFIQVDRFNVLEGRRLEVGTGRGVLRTVENRNDSQFRAVVAEKPRKGRLTLRNDGSFVYEPKSGKTGKDFFTYTIQDEFGSSIEGTGKVVIRIKKDG